MLASKLSSELRTGLVQTLEALHGIHGFVVAGAAVLDGHPVLLAYVVLGGVALLVWVVSEVIGMEQGICVGSS